MPVHINIMLSKMQHVTHSSLYTRSAATPAVMLLPLVLSGMSWAISGQPILTDVAMAIFAAICTIALLSEMRLFAQRLGVGAIVLYGGILVWVAHDYFKYWAFLEADAVISEHIAAKFYQPNVLAKTAFYNIFFFTIASIGLYIPWPKKLLTLFSVVPEPRALFGYIALPTALTIFGIMPYFVFTSEPFYMAIYNEIVGGYGGGAKWTVGRTGNTNYSWGGYIAQIISVGMAGGILAGCLAFFIRSLSTPGKLLLISQWIFWSLIAFGSGARGKLVAAVLPVVIINFLRYSAEIGAQLRRISYKQFMAAGLILACMLLGIAIVGSYRFAGFSELSFDEVAVSQVSGNEMFTAGLPAFSLIPSEVKPFYSSFPGEAIIRPYPDTAFAFITHPIPRALWKNKPVDPVWLWYNKLVSGADAEETGTTISRSLPGEWYIKYGISGIIQGGILFGFLLGGVERSIRSFIHRPITIFITLGVAVWLFRSFRDFRPADIVPLFLATVALTVVMRIWNLAGAKQQ